MAETQSKKVQLLSTQGVNLYPRTSVDNIVLSVGSTVSALATTISAASSASDSKIPSEKAVATALAGKAASSHTHSISNVSGLQTALDGKLSSSAQASASAFGAVKIGTNISVTAGVISIADATSTTKGVVTLGDHIAIANSNTSAPGGAAQCYAIKCYVADQLDSLSGTYVYVSNLVSDLSSVTGTGSGGGDNPATAWAVKQALNGKQNSLTQGSNVTISNSTVSVADASASAKGVVELATAAEAKAGTDTTRAVTPAGLASFLTYEEISA